MARKSKKAEAETEETKPEGPAQEGHNSNTGEVNEELQAIFTEYEGYEENKRQLNKAQRDLKAKAKERFGIQAGVFSHEVKMRKMESATRVQFEQQHKDLKVMLGYQFSLELLEETEDHEDDAESVAARLAS